MTLNVMNSPYGLRDAEEVMRDGLEALKRVHVPQALDKRERWKGQASAHDGRDRGPARKGLDALDAQPEEQEQAQQAEHRGCPGARRKTSQASRKRHLDCSTNVRPINPPGEPIEQSGEVV